MTKKELQQELASHNYKAAQCALQIVETQKELEQAKENLARETGAVLVLTQIVKNTPDDPIAEPSQKS